MLTHPVLTQLAAAGVKLGLDDIRGFLAAIDDPHLAMPTVHVAGTNGKGSVCTMVTEALVAAGLHVGTNTSPHLEHVNERIRIDGVAIDDGALGEGIESLDRARRAFGRSLGMARPPLTYFEFVTALAFRTFAERRVDAAVIEVGLGGRLDATNVVEPQACAITSVGLDHREQLGETLARIAGEKAGILKPGVPCAVGPLAPDALAAVEARALAVGAPLWRSGQQLRREHRSDGWMLATPAGTVGPVRLGMEGEHQGANASVAVGVLHLLRERGLPIPDEAIVEGLRRARVPGRLENPRPGLWLDGAHNEAASRALAAWLASRPRPGTRILLLGMGAERDPREVVAPLVPYVDEIVVTRCAHPKARDSRELGMALGDLGVLVSDGGPIEECLAEVYADADETLATGSLYLVGAVRALVGDGVLDGITPGSGA